MIMNMYSLLVIYVILVVLFERGGGISFGSECDKINSTSINNNNLCGYIIFSDDSNYEEYVEQYAYSSHPENVSPSMILYAKCDNDIKLILKYSIKCDYIASIRSGGHQYSGLSSCSSNGECVQIDMSYYSDMEIIDNDNNFISISSGVSHRESSTWLTKNDLFLPHGECYGVNIGGHVQTGGFGHIVRSYGALVDYMFAFDIILANGESKYVSRNDNNNKDLYWAVAGGNPGSFGVITKYYFYAERDSEHPLSVAQQAIFLYNKQDLTNMLYQYIDIINDLDILDPDNNIDLWITMIARPFDVDIIKIQGTWGDINGNQTYNSTLYDSIINAANTAPLLNILYPLPISRIQSADVYGFDGEREMPFPYIKRGRGTFKNDISTKFVDEFVNHVDDIFNHEETGLFYVSQWVGINGGNFKQNDPNNIITSISRRHITLFITSDIFYYDVLNENAKQNAIDFATKSDELWIYSGLFSDGKDIRQTWHTFGDVNIENVYQYYYDSEERYQTLCRIKRKYDGNNIFQTAFTLPVIDHPKKKRNNINKRKQRKKKDDPICDNLDYLGKTRKNMVYNEHNIYCYKYNIGDELINTYSDKLSYFVIGSNHFDCKLNENEINNMISSINTSPVSSTYSIYINNKINGIKIDFDEAISTLSHIEICLYDIFSAGPGMYLYGMQSNKQYICNGKNNLLKKQKYFMIPNLCQTHYKGWKYHIIDINDNNNDDIISSNIFGNNITILIISICFACLCVIYFYKQFTYQKITKYSKVNAMPSSDDDQNMEN